MLLNLIKSQRPHINKIKYQLLNHGGEEVGIKKLKNQKAFNYYSQISDNVYENLEDYNLTQKEKVLIMFDDKTADIKSNKTLNRIVTELFLRRRKLNISFVFISKSYFKVPKTKRLNATHSFITKILNKRELQQIASNHSSDIDFKDFMKFYKDYTKEPYLFLANGTTLSLDNPLRFRKTYYKNGY